MSTSIYTVGFWKDAGERAVSTFLQVVLATVGVDQIFSLGADAWKAAVVTAAGAAALSVGKSAIAALTGVKGTASLTRAVELVPQDPVDRLKAIAPGVRELVQREVVARVDEAVDQIGTGLTSAAAWNPPPSRGGSGQFATADPLVVPPLGR